MSTYRNKNSDDSFVCIDLTHPTCFRNNVCTHKCHSNLSCALDNCQAQTNGDLFTQVKLIHYLSTSPPPPLLCACVPLNPSIMVYDCNLNRRQTSDTSQYILFISAIQVNHFPGGVRPFCDQTFELSPA